MVQGNYTTGTQPVYSCDGKVIGQIEGQVFRKNIKGSKHLLRKPRAIAIDVYAYDEDIATACECIEVKDQETGITYVSTIENFNRYRIKLDRRHGQQYALPLGYWDYDGKQGCGQPPKPKPKVSPQLGFDWEVIGVGS